MQASVRVHEGHMGWEKMDLTKSGRSCGLVHGGHMDFWTYHAGIVRPLFIPIILLIQTCSFLPQIRALDELRIPYKENKTK